MSIEVQHKTIFCPICDADLPAAVSSWTYYCEQCDYWGSELGPVTSVLARDELRENTESDELRNPISYLDDLRTANFRRILRHIGNFKPPTSVKLLEVGCGPGLFLEAASALGMNALGIEPCEAMARQGQRNGCNIRIGLFPDCLEGHERFNVIVFNDVFEHLAKPADVLRTCISHLDHDGFVVLNLPNSHGLFFRMARILAMLGYRAPWNRMWQKMFYTPHLHYWSPQSLRAMCATVGLEPLTDAMELQSVSRNGLWRRITAAPGTTILGAVISFIGANCCAALVPYFPSDCYAEVFRKRP